MAAKMSRKQTMVIAYRKKKNLCAECGRYDKDDQKHECLENYVKADMRGIDLKPEDIVGNEDNIETPEKALPEIDTRIKTIISYRKRKNLCTICGKDVHEGTDCEEDYTESDTRDEKEKQEDPRTVKTPKEQSSSILEDMQQEKVNEVFLKNASDFYNLVPQNNAVSNRPYIVIDLSQSDHGQRFDYDYVEYMSRRHKNMIVYVLGDIGSVFSYSDCMKISKDLKNVCPITNLLDQNIVNYLGGCKRFFGFPSKYMVYCMTRDIQCTTFCDSEELDVPCNVVVLPNDQNVSLDLAKQNVLAWRV